jgi:hypothetical protein
MANQTAPVEIVHSLALVRFHIKRLDSVLEALYTDPDNLGGGDCAEIAFDAGKICNLLTPEFRNLETEIRAYFDIKDHHQDC